LDAPYNKIVVLSSAASGKSRIMTEKVRQLLRNNVDPRQIAVITFTNMAAAELKQRLGEDYKPGLFVGTIHALANYFLLSADIKTGKILDDEEFDKLFDLV
jgi:superfamily I DNA/RNA helicase